MKFTAKAFSLTLLFATLCLTACDKPSDNSKNETPAATTQVQNLETVAEKTAEKIAANTENSTSKENVKVNEADNKTPGNSAAPNNENTQEKTVENNDSAVKAQAVKQHKTSVENNEKVNTEKNQNQLKKQNDIVKIEKENNDNVLSKANQIQDKKAVSNKLTATTTSTVSPYKQELQAVLQQLTKQYNKIRCTETDQSLGQYSFCRQEERRLFLEIQRVKDQLRK